LVNSIENETHNGIATFRYRGNHVSGLRYQITAETAPFVIDTSFTAHGVVPAHYQPLAGPVPKGIIRTYKRAKAAAVPIAGWNALARKLGHAAPVIDTQVTLGELVLDGVDHHGVFYLRSCKGAAGPLAWCGRRRFGVWSATKSLITATALLRVAEKYGPSVFTQKIVHYVPELKASRAWHNVTFDNAINMATGVGNGDVKAPSEDFGNKTYMAWYLARSEHAKLAAMAKDSHPLPWGPGHKMRYRDQDMFVLGVALDRYLKAHEGPQAGLWSMLNRDVFRPIGIFYAPMNMTIEPDGASGQPLMAYGFYPTIGDMVKIARLYQAHGRFHGKQILYRPRIDKILDTAHAYGLPAGPADDTRAIDYYTTFWRHRYRLAPGCRRYIAEMNGYGSVTVALMPGNITGVRVAHTSSELVAGKGGVGLAPLAALGPACESKSVH
jgi:CubicO group peptidase (beta-lactamase class C family)